MCVINVLLFIIYIIFGGYVSNLKIIIKKSNYEPVEISFTSESFNTSSENKITNVEAKRTFSNINNTKVEKPEGIQ